MTAWISSLWFASEFRGQQDDHLAELGSINPKTVIAGHHGDRAKLGRCNAGARQGLARLQSNPRPFINLPTNRSRVAKTVCQCADPVNVMLCCPQLYARKKPEGNINVIKS